MQDQDNSSLPKCVIPTGKQDIPSTEAREPGVSVEFFKGINILRISYFLFNEKCPKRKLQKARRQMTHRLYGLTVLRLSTNEHERFQIKWEYHGQN